MAGILLVLRFNNQPAKPSESLVSGILPAPRSTSRMTSPSIAGETEPVSVINVARPSLPKTRIEELVEKLEPKKDEWDTEVLSDVVGRQLKILSEILQASNETDFKQVSNLVTEDFVCQTLRPVQLGKAFDDGAIMVRRWDTAPEFDRDEVAHGEKALIKALQTFHNSFEQLEDFRISLKLYRIEKMELHFSTWVLVETYHRQGENGVQQNATWRCQWAYPPAETSEPPRLMRIDLEQYENIALKLMC